MDVIQSFQKTVQRYRLFDQSHKLMIAVSGGSDSTALCHICHELGYQISIAHINYQLRDEDSNQDARFVESIAHRMDINLHIKSIDCQQYAFLHGLSIQEAARDIRYDFFDSMISMHGYDYILTAHHAKDNVETMIYALSKGASITGLRGIPISRDRIKRPLLHSTKEAIDLYLRRNDIQHRHDLSNDETKYKRNYIRHEIIPRLEQINPNLESTLSRTSMLGQGYQHLLEDLFEDRRSQFFKSKKLDLAPMISNQGKFAWLYEIIRTFGFNFTDALDIWATMDQKHSTGKTFSAAGNLLTLSRGNLLLTTVTNSADIKPVVINSIETAIADSNKKVQLHIFESIPKENGAYFDLHKLVFPLTIRQWQAGDRFRPSGMQGKSKKVKDYLTDQKISGPSRKAIEVMICQDEIIWIVGHRMADGYKATSDTKAVLSIVVK